MAKAETPEAPATEAPATEAPATTGGKRGKKPLDANPRVNWLTVGSNRVNTIVVAIEAFEKLALSSNYQVQGAKDEPGTSKTLDGCLAAIREAVDKAEATHRAKLAGEAVRRSAGFTLSDDED